VDIKSIPVMAGATPGSMER